MTLEKQTDQQGISMYAIEGPLFFGTTDSLENSILDHVQTKPKTLILLMNKVNYMDTSAEAVLMNISNRLKHHNGKLMIVGLQSQPKELLRRTGLFHHIGKQHFFERTDDISPQRL